MNLFRRTPQVDTSDPQVPLEIHEAREIVERDTPEWAAIAWGPKPDELTRAAAVTAWNDNHPLRHWETLTPAVLHWSDAPPNTAGLWWFRVKGLPQVKQCVVVDFGGKLCVRFKQGDSVRFTSVSVLERSWCGPIATPPDVALDELELVA